MILEIIPCCSSSKIRKSEVGRVPTRSNNTAVKGGPDKDGGGLGWIPVAPSQNATLIP